MTVNQAGRANWSGSGSNPIEDPVLEVRDATVTFDMERGTSRVLDGVNLDIERGEVVGVVGESGSGKSMLASSMVNAVVEPGQLSGEVFYHPDGGESVDILSLDEEGLKARRWNEISFLVQAAQSAFNPTMTIIGHFRETLNEHDRDMKAGLERAHELLSDLHLNPEQVLHSYPHELSGGMKQRALIALSLVLDPEVLVMDEPTAALDLLMQRSILSLLSKLKEKYDLTMVFITHDLPLVADLADRLAVMYAFNVIELGPTASVLDSSAHPYTRALLNSVPTLSTPNEQMRPIPGSSPDPVDVPEGCSYHPRCSLADSECRDFEPPLEQVSEEHLSACFHWDQVDDDIVTHGGEAR